MHKKAQTLKESADLYIEKTGPLIKLGGFI